MSVFAEITGTERDLFLSNPRGCVDASRSGVGVSRSRPPRGRQPPFYPVRRSRRRASTRTRRVREGCVGHVLLVGAIQCGEMQLRGSEYMGQALGGVGGGIDRAHFRKFVLATGSGPGEVGQPDRGQVLVCRQLTSHPKRSKHLRRVTTRVTTVQPQTRERSGLGHRSRCM